MRLLQTKGEAQLPYIAGEMADGQGLRPAAKVDNGCLDLKNLAHNNLCWHVDGF